jgi:YHS domain-containing protein
MFFKLLENGDFTFGQYVHSVDYMLVEESKDSYTYPIDGWYYFATEDEAKTFFGISDE